MTKATEIKRMSSALKAEAVTAVSKFFLYDYTVESNRIVDNETGEYSTIIFYRNGSEVIAVPDMYIGEDSIDFTGSQGNEYTLFDDKLYVGFYTSEPA